MNEKEEKLVARIFSEVIDMKLSKYQSLFLYQLAIRRYKVNKKGKDETMDVSAGKIMKRMPELCKKTAGLEHKRNIVETSANKCLRNLDEELSNADLDEKFFRGDTVINVIDYLIRE